MSNNDQPKQSFVYKFELTPFVDRLINTSEDSANMLNDFRIRIDADGNLYMLMYIDSDDICHDTICVPSKAINSKDMINGNYVVGNTLVNIADHRRIRSCTYYQRISYFQMCRLIVKYSGYLNIELSIDDINDILTMITYKAPFITDITHRIHYIKMKSKDYLLLNTKYGVFNMCDNNILNRKACDEIKAPTDFSYIVTDSLERIEKWSEERFVNNSRIKEFISENEHSDYVNCMVDLHSDDHTLINIDSNHMIINIDNSELCRSDNLTMIGRYSNISDLTELI